MFAVLDCFATWEPRNGGGSVDAGEHDQQEQALAVGIQCVVADVEVMASETHVHVTRTPLVVRIVVLPDTLDIVSESPLG